MARGSASRHPQSGPRCRIAPWLPDPGVAPTDTSRAARPHVYAPVSRSCSLLAAPSCAPVSAAAPPQRLQLNKSFCISLFKLSSRLNQSPRAASPRAAPAVQAARPQPPVLSVRCGASRQPAGGIQRWPAAGTGRAGLPQARAAAGRVAAGWHGVGGRGRWQRPFDFPIPLGSLALQFLSL